MLHHPDDSVWSLDSAVFVQYHKVKDIGEMHFKGLKINFSPLPLNYCNAIFGHNIVLKEKYFNIC